jgi:hypothetical protein
MRALWIAAPVLVWALHFTAIYGFTSLACARAMAHLVPWIVAATTLAAAAAAAALLTNGWRERDDFVHWMTAATAALALVAIVYEAVGVYLLPSCG